MKVKEPTILIIIGIFGDLSRRKLLPALAQMAKAGALPDKFLILGLTRRSVVDIEKFLAEVKNIGLIKDKIEIMPLDASDLNSYRELKSRISQIEDRFGAATQRFFYLAVPPQVSQPIISHIGDSGLAKEGITRLLIEKPFGVDLASARSMIEEINRNFSADQVYRIDHYLAKEMAQNLIFFRSRNPLFGKTWNNGFIERIEIIAIESMGIEGRASFYEQTGAMRDLVQSHLLQLAALVLMDMPKTENVNEIPGLRLRALEQIAVSGRKRIEDIAKRGQYEGYQSEVDNIGSQTETFVSLRLESKDPRWIGVPILLTTGKALDKKLTVVKITFKKDGAKEPNQLNFYLQPDEGVELRLLTKRPGYDYTASLHPLKFGYEDYYANLPEAYEQVLFNAFNSDNGLFATGQEVVEAWRILEPIRQAWEMSSRDLFYYEPGSTIESLL